ncbi:heterokaryon incompatibility protein-domain-containing protein [Trametes meyenii]|nr:heterokaryon incompatibility protein-domain-containing protein [Trametes meyenii]
MRLLNTQTGQFYWVADPSRVHYAILSHTWASDADGGEQSYADVLSIQAESVASVWTQAMTLWSFFLRYIRTPATSEPPSILSHPMLSNKIRRTCEVALRDGYDFVWIDSCCIDKSSSEELSEAINSMYQWYSLADICYVYLSDVHDNDGSPEPPSSAFSKSRWHRRGWTLQELIAPKQVVFMTSSWRRLGTKIDLASPLKRITGIGTAILTGKAPLDSVSVARRMSWAALRETTRAEDKAYALLGIFGVHISPIYGEGSHAFIRLQEEIIKTVPDQSIFAWGPTCILSRLGVSVDPLENLDVRSNSEFERHESGLLAQSPKDFVGAGEITGLSPQDFTNRLGRTLGTGALPPPLLCVFTPEGVRIQLLCVNLAKVHQVLCLALRQGIQYSGTAGPDGVHAHSLALLRCQDKEGRMLALPLYHPQERLEEGLAVGTGPGSTKAVPLPSAPWRVIRVTGSILEAANSHFMTPCELFIRRHTISYPLRNETEP